jgi:hypothetical protein
LCSAAPCLFCFVLFCFEAICDRYFFKLNCFKLIGWFNHHNVFPPIGSVCYRFVHFDYKKLYCDYKKLHCDYTRKLHCDYRKLHCCLGLTALKSTNHSRVVSLCILLAMKKVICWHCIVFKILDRNIVSCLKFPSFTSLVRKFSFSVPFLPARCKTFQFLIYFEFRFNISSYTFTYMAVVVHAFGFLTLRKDYLLYRRFTAR